MGDTLLSPYFSQTVNKHPLLHNLIAHFFIFWGLLLVILLLEMALKHNAKELFTVHKDKKSLMEKSMLDKLHSGMSYSAVGHVNGSTIYIE